jgi:hypothetical protein
MINDNGDIILDTPDEINMFALLSMRGRLHLEIKGIMFRQSTLKALQRQGITKARTRKGALADLNAHIAKLGGPEDRRV